MTKALGLILDDQTHIHVNKTRYVNFFFPLTKAPHMSMLAIMCVCVCKREGENGMYKVTCVARLPTHPLKGGTVVLGDPLV